MYAIRSQKRGFFVSELKSFGLIHFTDFRTQIPFRTYEDPEHLLRDFERLSQHVDDLVICEFVDEKTGG